MAKFQRTVSYYTKNGKRYIDVSLGRGQGYITLSQAEIEKKRKK